MPYHNRITGRGGVSDAISYTAATGKRPMADDGRGMEPGDGFTWFRTDPRPSMAKEPVPPEDLPIEVFARLEGGVLSYNHQWRDYDTESAALKAADEAYLRAVADGAMAAIGEGVA